MLVCAGPGYSRPTGGEAQSALRPVTPMPWLQRLRCGRGYHRSWRSPAPPNRLECWLPARRPAGSGRDVPGSHRAGRPEFRGLSGWCSPKPRAPKRKPAGTLDAGVRLPLLGVPIAIKGRRRHRRRVHLLQQFGDSARRRWPMRRWFASLQDAGAVILNADLGAGDDVVVVHRDRGVRRHPQPWDLALTPGE